MKLLKEFNESIIESINVGLLAVDLEGRVTRLNSALEHILDLRRDAAVGKRVEDLFSEDFADTLKQVLGKDGWRLKEIRNIYKLHTATRGNRSLVLNIALAPLQDGQGQTGALVVLEDVTARITSRRTIATAREALVDRFAGRRCGARSEHAFDRCFVLHADAAGNVERKRSEARVAAESAHAG